MTDELRQQIIQRVAQHNAGHTPCCGHWLAPTYTRMILMLPEGKSNKEIAEELGLSEATVKNKFTRAFNVTGTQDRLQLLCWALGLRD